MKQKLTAFLLCFVMALSLCAVLPFGSLAEEGTNAEIWDSSIATAYAGGEGTAEDPYQIANGAQLALMAQQVNAGINADKSFVLTADIVLNDVTNYENFSSKAPANNWTSIGREIGDTIYAFEGTFDGQGHTIYGMYFSFKNGTDIYRGLFGYALNATIKNVTLAKGYVRAGVYLGSLVGYANNCEISGITNESVEVYLYKNYVNSTNTATGGGIVGVAKDGTTLYNCHNKAPLSFFNASGSSSTGTLDVNGGGIVGIMTTNGTANRFSIIGCSNTATIRGGTGHDWRTTNLGGIVGSATKVDIFGCYTSGAINATVNGSGHIGGIVANANSCTISANVSSMALDTYTQNTEVGMKQNAGNFANCGGIVASDSGSTLDGNVFYGTQQIVETVAGDVARSGVIVGNSSNTYLRNNAFLVDAENSEVTSLRGTQSKPKEETNNQELTAQTLVDSALVDALNAYSLGQNKAGALYVQSENGPVFAVAYAESYTITLSVGIGGAASIVSAPMNIPASFGLEAKYKVGDVVVIEVEAEDGFVPKTLEYTFGGETVALERNQDGTFSFVMPQGPVVLNAVFEEAAKLVVTFLDKDGGVLDTQEVEYGQAATAPAAPAVEGCTFVGWDTDFSEVKDNLFVSALYEVSVYTVTFLDKDGNTISAQDIKHGEAAIAPIPPTVEGYGFVCWDTAFDSVKSELTVRAIYEKTFVVTFLGINGGTVLKTETVFIGTAATAPEIPEVLGFEFVAWDVAFDNVTADITVTAQYQMSGNFFAGGQGTAEDPYVIASLQDLLDLAAYIASADLAPVFTPASYRLDADIDMTGVVWTPIADISGDFDGNGHVISNFKITKGAFFTNASGSIRNLTFRDAISTSGSLMVGTVPKDRPLTIDNCHVINGKITAANQTPASLMVTHTNAKLLVKNSSVDGIINIHAYATCGGFLARMASPTTVTFEDCISTVDIRSTSGGNGMQVSAGGFAGNAGSNEMNYVFKNCVFAGTIDLKAEHGAGAFLGQKRSIGSVTFTNCVNYGSIRNTLGAAGGLMGTADIWVALSVTDCAVYGSVESVGYQAGGLIGQVFKESASLKVNRALVMAKVTGAEGKTGLITGVLEKNTAHYVKATFIAKDGILIGNNKNPEDTITIDCQVLTSTTTLPEVLAESGMWEIGAMPTKIAGVSVSLGNTISVNVYANLGIVLKSHTAKLFVNGQYVTAGEKATVDGVEYFKYIFDGLNAFDMDKALALSLIGAQATQQSYAVTTYLANTYKDYADDANLVALIESIVVYGNAAQMAAGVEATVLSTFAAALELELEEGYAEAYLAAKFAEANLKTHAGLNAAGMALDLSGNVIPVFTVGEGVEKVYVTVYGSTTEVTVVDGRAYFYGLNATSLNNLMTVSYTAADGTEVSFDTNVAMYIETALATEGLLTEDQATLAQALAVYMRAARTFVGLD